MRLRLAAVALVAGSTLLLPFAGVASADPPDSPGNACPPASPGAGGGPPCGVADPTCPPSSPGAGGPPPCGKPHDPPPPPPPPPIPADPCTAAAGDPGLLTDDTLGQTLWDAGLQIPPLTEDPDANGPLSGAIYDGGNGSGLEPVTDEVACLVDLLIDESTGIDL